MGDDIALLCSLFPATVEKQKRVCVEGAPFTRIVTCLQPYRRSVHCRANNFILPGIAWGLAKLWLPRPLQCIETVCKTDSYFSQVLDLVRKGEREYYRQPKAKCTTWSYYTPFRQISGQPVIGGLEIYTSKAGISDQVNDKEFLQSYHEIVKKEGLYAKDEELTAYYLAAGFIAREDHALPFGGGTLISLTRFDCKDKAAVLEVMEGFIEFVRKEEPIVLTYAAFERKKAPKELLLFVRYRDVAGMKRHSRAPEHTDIIAKLSKLLENDITKETTLWQEVEDSFVSTRVGGPAGSSKL